MVKTITTITLDSELKEAVFKILRNREKTLSGFIHEKLEELIQETLRYNKKFLRSKNAI